MKSYGRAPTFLMLTGYEQVRSIACALTGDMPGARRVELTLPATGVCSAQPSSFQVLEGVAPDSGSSCCGGPAPAEVDACCAQDADAKASGQDGCGCGLDLAAGAAEGERPGATASGATAGRAAAGDDQRAPERHPSELLLRLGAMRAPGPTWRITPERYGWVIVATLSVTETVTWGIVSLPSGGCRDSRRY